MSKSIDSDALGLINRILGLGGGGESDTDLEDQTLVQVLDVAAAVRRSLAGGVREGWFTGVMDNIHAAAGAVVTTVNPYTTSDVPTGGSWPQPVPKGLDIWVLGAALVVTGAGGGLDGGMLNLDPLPAQQGWGRDSAGAAVVGSGEFPIVRWTGIDSSVAPVPVGITGDGSVFVKTLVRIARGTQLLFRTDATAADTFRCTVLLGLFPEALGQDVAQ